jgi:hypothetical protein
MKASCHCKEKTNRIWAVFQPRTVAAGGDTACSSEAALQSCGAGIDAPKHLKGELAGGELEALSDIRPGMRDVDFTALFFAAFWLSSTTNPICLC